MVEWSSIGTGFLFGAVMWLSVLGLRSPAIGSDEGTEVLNVSVGEPTFLSGRRYQNSAGER